MGKTPTLFGTTKGDPVGFDINDYVGSGLWDGGRCTIRNPRFTRIPEYRDGQQVLLLVDIKDEDEGVELIDQRIGLGNGWIANDDETEITDHEAGKKLKYNDKTAVGRMLKTMPKEMVAALGERWKQGDEVTPFKVGFWDGLQVTLRSASEDLDIDGDKVTQNWYEFVSFEGYEGAGSNGKKPAAKKAPAKKAAKKAAAKKSEPAEEPDTDDSSTDIDPAVVEAIVAQAWEADDFDEFVANCYANVEQVAESEAYQAMVEDDSEDSIWGKVCAEAE